MFHSAHCVHISDVCMFVHMYTYIRIYIGEDNTAVYLEDVPIGALPYGEGELPNCSTFWILCMVRFSGQPWSCTMRA